MTRSPSDAADAAHAWQQPIAETQRTRAGLYAWRIFIAICFLIAIVLFGVLLFRLFFHATTHLIVLKASGLKVLDGPPVAVAGTEIGLLEPLSDVATYEGPEPTEAFDSPQAFRSWSSKLDALQLRPQDSLIIYLAAHGISYDGNAYLVCNNFDPATPTVGLYPIQELLSSLGRVQANVKMLILDSGQIDYDPALGLVVNDFMSLLQQDVGRANDRNLWVLCSNSNGQRSHKVPSLGASVFGTFVAGGLRGPADQDENGEVTVGELADFVTTKVVAATQGGEASGPQLPLLLHAEGQSGRELGKTIPLLSVGGLNQPPENEDVDRLVLGVETRTALIPRIGIEPTTSGGRGFLAQLAAPASPTGPPVASEGQFARAGAPNAEAGEGGAAADGSSDDASQATPDAAQAASLRNLRYLLEHAWNVRDRLAESSNDGAGSEWRPIDATPHLWRETHEELIAHEQILLGSDPNAVASAQNLQTALAKFWTLQDEKPVLVRDFRRIAGTADDAAAPPVELSQLKSLAIGRRVAGLFPPDAHGPFEQPGQLLDTLIDANPDEFTQKITELESTPGWEGFYELRLVTQMNAVGGVDPSLAQLALQTRRDAERVAASSIRHIEWMDDGIETADRARLAAERQILDQIGSGWQTKARDLLQRAMDGYALSTQVRQDVEQANRLRSDMAFRAPYYVRWRARELSAAYPNEDDDNRLDAFLDRLNELSDLLDNPQDQSIRRLSEICNALSQIENDLGEQLKSARNDMWQPSRLLETPLPSALARRGLVEGAYFDTSLADADARRLVQAFTPIATSGSASNARNGFPVNVIRQFGWEVKLARLAVGSDTSSPDKASRALEQAERELQHLTTLLTTPNAATSNDEVDIDDPRWSAVHRFGRAIQTLYAALPDRITKATAAQTSLPRHEAHRRIVRAQRALQFLHPRDAHRFRNVDVALISRDLHLHDLLLWHASRFVRAQADAPATEVDYLSDAADDYVAEAQRIYPAAPVTGGSMVEIDAPPRVSLVSRPRRTVEIPVHYRGVGSADAWVILQYDSDLVEIGAPENVSHEHALAAKINASLESSDIERSEPISEADRRLAVAYPYRPDLAGIPPTWQAMRRGEPQKLSLELHSRGRGRETAQVVVKVISRPATGAAAGNQSPRATNESEIENTVSYVRQSIEVPLRVVDVALDAHPNSWQQQGEKLILHTFPNRVTSYTFGIVNHGPSDREISLRFFAPETSLDVTALSDAEVTKAISRLKPSGELTIPAPADGEPHFATAPEAAAPQAADAEAAPVPAPEEPEAAPPAGPPLRNGMLVEIKDSNDPRQSFVKQVEIVPQRPRRYVTPAVTYNSRLERIDVTVTPRLGLDSLLPPGQVTVECQIAEDAATQTEGKLRDVLRAPDYEARLFAYVPASPPRVVTLHLHVDGYPRAFVYRVPCGAHAVDVPEQKKLAALRLRKTAWPDYQPPAAVTPVEAQVDSSVGTFESGGDVVQVALDENMDQLMGPEQGQRMPTDRQADAYLQALGDDGVLTVDTRVADHQVGLFTDRLQNVRVLVHGQLSAAGNLEDSGPITLNIDGSPPSVNYVEVSPWGGFVAAGTELQVAVTASDQMSGVKLVEVGFDVDGTGNFSDKATPVVAVPDPARYSIDLAANSLSAGPSTRSDAALAGNAKPEHWIAKLPTDGVLGFQTLIVRATDHVGNASEFYGKRVQILTPAQAAAKVQQQAKQIEGTVIFRNQPVPGAEVTLLDADAKELATSPAGADGRFSLAGVPPGKYAVRAEGVVNNVTRFGTQEIVLELTPVPVVRTDIRLE